MSVRSEQPNLTQAVQPAETAVQPATEMTQTAEPAKTGEQPAAQLTAEQLKIPETLEATDEIKSEFLGILNKDLPPEQRAQALIDLQSKIVQGMSEKANAAWAEQVGTWHKEIAADPEIGGQNAGPVVRKIGLLIDKINVPGFREAMDMTNAGNHPAVVRFMAKISDLLVEGGHVSGTPATAANGDQSAALSRLYPTMRN